MPDYSAVHDAAPADDDTVRLLLCRYRTLADVPRRPEEVWDALAWMGGHVPGVLARLAAAERAAEGRSRTGAWV